MKQKILKATTLAVAIPAIYIFCGDIEDLSFAWIKLIAAIVLVGLYFSNKKGARNAKNNTGRRSFYDN